MSGFAKTDRRTALRSLSTAAFAAAWSGLVVPALPGSPLAQARAHALMGPVTPRLAAPALPLVLHDGRNSHLPTLLQGQVTALQLMFCGCRSTCPVQGAIFAALQARLAAQRSGVRLLSISIDPLNDDAAALSKWRQRLGAGAQWTAAVPPLRHANVMLNFLEAQRAGEDRHAPQVYLFDTQGRLAFRCAEWASAADIAQALAVLQRNG